MLRGENGKIAENFSIPRLFGNMVAFWRYFVVYYFGVCKFDPLFMKEFPPYTGETVVRGSEGLPVEVGKN